MPCSCSCSCIYSASCRRAVVPSVDQSRHHRRASPTAHHESSASSVRDGHRSRSERRGVSVERPGSDVRPSCSRVAAVHCVDDHRRSRRDVQRRTPLSTPPHHSPNIVHRHATMHQYSPHTVNTVHYTHMVLRPTRHKIGHFGDVLPSQFLGIVAY